MRHNHKEMRKLYEQWRQSGLSRKAFCRKKGIVYQTFNYWYKRFKAEVPSGFTEISLPADKAVTCELSFPTGARISFQDLPSASWLKELVG